MFTVQDRSARVTTGRRLVCAGLFVMLAPIFLEAAVTVPERLPKWYPAWFWVPATGSASLAAFWAGLKPSDDRMLLVFSVVTVWAVCRAVLNLSQGWHWQAVIGGSIWLGLALALHGGARTAAASSR